MPEYIERQKVFDALPIVTKDKQISLYGAVSDFIILVSAIPSADVKEIETNAIKRFADRLKPMYKVLCVDEGDWLFEIDKIVKEITEEIK